MQQFNDARDWFFEKRYGLFIHWGLYAINAWHEQDQWRRSIPRAEYVPLQQQFNPINFDPDAWLDVAEAAGMEYLCFTTKHHDGFCMWDTAETDFNIMNTPYSRDILALLAEACHRRNFPLCLYHSVVDWHHPNYPNQGRSHELPQPEPGDTPDFDKYLAFLKAQVRELCTNYGPLHGFWWDMNVTGEHIPEVNNMIRELQPAAVINNRGFDEGDFGTPERDNTTADEVCVFDTPTEACQSVGRESWGYRENEDYYSDLHIMRSIDKTLAKGGNFLLNIGPKADGTLPEEGISIIQRVGKWYTTINEAFAGTEPLSHQTDNTDILLTGRDNTLYVHLFDEPTMRRVLIPPIDRLPTRATLLNTGASLAVSNDSLPTQHMGHDGKLQPQAKKDFLRVADLPVNALAGEIMVIKLEFDT